MFLLPRQAGNCLRGEIRLQTQVQQAAQCVPTNSEVCQYTVTFRAQTDPAACIAMNCYSQLAEQQRGFFALEYG